MDLCVALSRDIAFRKLDETVHLMLQADRLYLYEFFAPLGAVQSVRVLTDDSGQCRGVGFVNYVNNASALAAIQARFRPPLSGVRVPTSGALPPVVAHACQEQYRNVRGAACFRTDTCNSVAPASGGCMCAITWVAERFRLLLRFTLRVLQALNGTPVAGGRVLHVSLQPPRDRGSRSS